MGRKNETTSLLGGRGARLSKKFDRERALAEAYYEVEGERSVHDDEYDQFVGA
jgi:hypothetical protein